MSGPTLVVKHEDGAASTMQAVEPFSSATPLKMSMVSEPHSVPNASTSYLLVSATASTRDTEAQRAARIVRREKRMVMGSVAVGGEEL